MENQTEEVQKCIYSGRLSTLVGILHDFCELNPDMTVQEMFEKFKPVRYNCIKLKSEDNSAIKIKEIYKNIEFK